VMGKSRRFQNKMISLQTEEPHKHYDCDVGHEREDFRRFDSAKI
jgi:hypothetical protein